MAAVTSPGVTRSYVNSAALNPMGNHHFEWRMPMDVHGVYLQWNHHFTFSNQHLALGMWVWYGGIPPIWERGFDMEVWYHHHFENVGLIWRFDIIIFLRMWVWYGSIPPTCTQCVFFLKMGHTSNYSHVPCFWWIYMAIIGGIPHFQTHPWFKTRLTNGCKWGYIWLKLAIY